MYNVKVLALEIYISGQVDCNVVIYLVEAA